MTDAPSNWPPPGGAEPPPGAGPGGPTPPPGYAAPGQYPAPQQPGAPYPGQGQPQYHPGQQPSGPPAPGAFDAPQGPGGYPAQPPGPGYGAPPPYGPPGAGAYGGPPPYAAPPAKKKSWVKGCLIAAGIFVVISLLGIGGCAVAVRAGFRAVTAPVGASNRWLDAIDDKADDDVRDLTCPSLRNDLDQVAALLERNDWDGSQDLTSSNIVNSSAVVEGTLGTSGGDVQVSISLAKASDDRGYRGWCVNGITVT